MYVTLNPTHPASNIYDVFVFKGAGIPTIGTGPAWNTATAGSGARGTGAGTTELTRAVGGLWTNAFAMTARNGATTYAVNVNQGTYVGSDRKSTRLNSSHSQTSYAVFCLKEKNSHP